MRREKTMTLGEIINELKAVKNQASEIRFDFAYFRPARLISWRGSYDQLAIDYTNEHPGEKSVAEFLKECESAIGKTFTGYKGGDFEMGFETPVWVAGYGESCETAVIGFINTGYDTIIIETSYREY